MDNTTKDKGLQGFPDAEPVQESEVDAGNNLPAEKSASLVSDEDAKKARNQKGKLLDIAFAAKERWQTIDGAAGLTIEKEGHYEHYLVRSTGFKHWLNGCYYRQHNDAPSSQAFSEALAVIEADCFYSGDKYPVYYRIGRAGDCTYIDLANDAWQIIEITADGWNVTTDDKIKFLRHQNMQPQCVPERGGAIEQLKPFINYGHEGQFSLLVGYILKALDPENPYPLLAVIAEQGSGKSELTKMLSSLIDPSSVPLRAKSKTEQDLMVLAKRNHLISFDNLSGMSHDFSDALCRLATGGGIGGRKLFTDDEEAAFYACRPIILNGIQDVIERPDLLDRATLVTLPPIPEKSRIDPNDLWKSFEEAKPKILGVLCDGLASALKHGESVTISRKPRMVGYVRFVTAAEKAFGWPAETFLSAYIKSQDEANRASIDMNPLASAVRHMIEREGNIKCQASELLNKLNEHADDTIRKSPFWPKLPNKLSSNLTRCQPQLRRIGINIEKKRENGQRWIVICQQTGEEIDRLYRPIVQKPLKPAVTASFGSDDKMTIDDDKQFLSSSLKPAVSNGLDDKDDKDDKKPLLSKGLNIPPDEPEIMEAVI